MTDDELAEIERVWAEASPGPWKLEERRPGDTRYFTALVDNDSSEPPVIYPRDGDMAIARANVVAITSAPLHVAALLAEVRSLREKWNQGRPTESGLYWFRSRPEGAAVVVRVSLVGDELVVMQPGDHPDFAPPLSAWSASTQWQVAKPPS
jgi:hypothetical protein